MIARVLLPVFALFVLSPWGSPALALVAGAFVALAWGNPFLRGTQKLAKELLPICVVGLGAGMDLTVVAKAGAHGVVYTVIGIAATFALGHLFRGLLRGERVVGLLITVGTAICGGSAIAAVAPVVRAKPPEISVALGTVFLLNALALVLFPWVGHLLSLDETRFGLWSALAIHDTSSVVGATLQFGPVALATGTTVKLARALWIVPVTFFVAFLFRAEGAEPVKKPWFILGFVLTAALFTAVPGLSAVGEGVAFLARKGLLLTLFLIGANLTRATLRQVGWRPLVFGFVLWAMVTAGTLAAIIFGLIS